MGNYDFKGAYLGTAVQGNLKITGYSLAAVGTFPINSSVGIFGKLGVFSWDAKASASSGSINNSASGSGSNALYGLGLKYNVTKQFSIRGEWDRFHDSNAVDLLSVGVAYKF